MTVSALCLLNLMWNHWQHLQNGERKMRREAVGKCLGNSRDVNQEFTRTSAGARQRLHEAVEQVMGLHSEEFYPPLFFILERYISSRVP